MTKAPARPAPTRPRSHAPAASGLPGPLPALRDAARHGTCFDVLGLRPDASTTQVREAYVALSAVLHDLRARADGAEALAVLDEVEQVARDAFAVLADPDLRLQYRRALAPPARGEAPGDGREPWQS